MPKAEGYFNINQKEDRSTLVEFFGEHIYVKTVFPDKPEFANQTAYTINQDPLVQLFFTVGERLDTSNNQMMRMLLSNIDKEYQGLNLRILKIQESTPNVTQRKGLDHYSQQFVVDLTGGYREFVKVNLYRHAEYDVMSLSRFTLSPKEKDDLKHRIRGNDITETFHDALELRVPPILKQE